MIYLILMIYLIGGLFVDLSDFDDLSDDLFDFDDLSDNLFDFDDLFDWWFTALYYQ